MMNHPSQARADLRRAYADAWRRKRDGVPLTPLDALLVDVIGLHPEYWAVIDESDARADADPSAASHAFLHLGLHVAIREQISVDRPPGVRALHARLIARHGEGHVADHVLVDALAETLWAAQQSGQVPDEVRYLDRVRSRL